VKASREECGPPTELFYTVLNAAQNAHGLIFSIMMRDVFHHSRLGLSREISSYSFRIAAGMYCLRRMHVSFLWWRIHVALSPTQISSQSYCFAHNFIGSCPSAGARRSTLRVHCSYILASLPYTNNSATVQQRRSAVPPSTAGQEQDWN
jgi:hypothetical protein